MPNLVYTCIYFGVAFYVYMYIPVVIMQVNGEHIYLVFVSSLEVRGCVLHLAPSADSEYVYEEMEGEMKAKLMALAENACTYLHGER